MSITIDPLELGSVTGDASFLVRGRPPGETVTVPDYGFLIRGAGDKPILVDTGYRSVEVMRAYGFEAEIRPGCDLDSQLANHDLERGDIGLLVLTHLHLDHVGAVDRFPMSTPVVVNRREMEHAASGAFFYQPEDLHHMIDRIATPGAVVFLDLGLTGPVEIAPGVTCELAGGHTPGLMFVRAETEDGVATICSDVIYEIAGQLLEPPHTLQAREPQTSNNFTVSVLEEKAAIKRALNGTTFLLPSHCNGARVECGQVVGALDGASVPGPRIPPERAPSGPVPMV